MVIVMPGTGWTNKKAPTVEEGADSLTTVDAGSYQALSYKCEQEDEKIIYHCQNFTKCKEMAHLPIFVPRRSFHAVEKSCVINLNSTQCQIGATPLR
jgi:hypothetical protein